MARDYRSAVRQALHAFGERTHLDPGTETVRLFDDDSGAYAVADLMWEEGERQLQPLVVVRVREGKVIVDINTTDQEVELMLLAAGVAYTDLVLDEQ
jgi:hypothetical protein